MRALGPFLFRWRNALFPAAVLGLLAAFPARPGAWPARAPLGLLLLALGQGLRVLTIGLPYVKRGGSKGRFAAPGLVTGGMFAHCRNPMYLGNLLVVAGAFTVAGNPAGVAAAAALFGFFYAAIVRGEERFLSGRFGEAYRDYARAVPRWLPRLAGLLSTLRAHRFDWRRVVAKEYGTLYATLLLALLALACAHAASAGWEGLRRGAAPYLAAAAAGGAAWAAARFLKKSDRLKGAAARP